MNKEKILENEIEFIANNMETETARKEKKEAEEMVTKIEEILKLCEEEAKKRGLIE